MGNLLQNRDEAVIRVAAHIGELINFWGFNPHCGRAWALLYLNPDPLTADQVAGALKISAGLTSQALTELRRWGVVERIRKQGGPGYLYSAETNIWRCITRVLNEREMGWLDRTVEELERALEVVKGSQRDAIRTHQVSRLSMLLTLTKGMRGLLKTFLAAGRIDAASIRKLLRLSAGGVS
jgi:DNA-binding transcriptional regulator GbsR (MarR family)